MPISTIGILRMWRYYFYKGKPPIMPELQGAKCTVTKKGSNLDSIIQTPGLGDFEIKVLKDSAGEYYVDEINYVNPLIHKTNVYKSLKMAAPTTTSSASRYKVTVKNNNMSFHIPFNNPFISGSARIRIGPDRKREYHIKKFTLYNKHRKKRFSYAPPVNKPKSKASAYSSSSASQSAGKPSP
jgi:hypothetical protein